VREVILVVEHQALLNTSSGLRQFQAIDSLCGFVSDLRFYDRYILEILMVVGTCIFIYSTRNVVTWFIVLIQRLIYEIMILCVSPTTQEQITAHDISNLPLVGDFRIPCYKATEFGACWFPNRTWQPRQHVRRYLS
jgi:hypothetical protein